MMAGTYSDGRKLKLTAHQRQEALERRAAGEALIEIARTYNLSHSRISRLASRGERSHEPATDYIHGCVGPQSADPRLGSCVLHGERRMTPRVIK